MMAKPKKKQRVTKATKATKSRGQRKVHLKEEMYPPNELIKATLVKTFGRISVAARILGCDRILIHRRMQRHPWLLEACREARHFVVPFTETKLFQNVANNDQRAIEFVLKNRGKGWTKADDEDARSSDLGTVIAMFQKTLLENKPAESLPSGSIIDVTVTDADPKPQTS